MFVSYVDLQGAIHTHDFQFKYNRDAFLLAKLLVTGGEMDAHMVDRTVHWTIPAKAISAYYNADKSVAEAMAKKIANDKAARTPKAFTPTTDARVSIAWQAKGKGPVYALSFPNRGEAEQAVQELVSSGNTAKIIE